MQSKPHIAVVGAGIVGLCTSHFLNKSGFKVTLIDHKDPGSMTSFGHACTFADYASVPINSPSLFKDIPSMLLKSDGPLAVDFLHILKNINWATKFLQNCTTKKVNYISTSLGKLLNSASISYDEIFTEINVAKYIKHQEALYLYLNEKEFLKAKSTNELRQKNGVKIWNEWANEKGDLGPVYGHQWRNWNSEGIDQIHDMINTIKTNPDSRRILVSAWNPSVMPDTSISFSENISKNKAALPPCHAFFQCYIANEKLSVQLYQRSADVFLGVPFNIASYALLAIMIAQVTGYKPGEFIHTFGDAHIYSNHKDQITEQLNRHPKNLPKIKLNPKIKNLLDFTYNDIEVLNYDPYPLIKGKVSV